MAKISKPEANPAVALLLSFFLFQTGHIIVNGQTKKWLFIVIAILVGELLCCLPGIVIAILSLVDSYQTAVKLKAGAEIDENGYANPTLFKIMKIIQKDAVLIA